MHPAFEVATMKKIQAQPGHDVFVTTLTELIGISILAVVADMSDDFGKIAVALMAGWLLIFVITNDLFLKGVTAHVQ